jgi:RHS repeat-associated protein
MNDVLRIKFDPKTVTAVREPFLNSYGFDLTDENYIGFTTGKVKFTIMGFRPTSQFETLIATVKICLNPHFHDEYTHVQKIDLYNNDRIDAYSRSAAFQLKLNVDEIKKGLCSLRERLERYRIDELKTGGGEEKETPVTAKEQREALDILKADNLLECIEGLLKQAGVVTETENGLRLFLILLSRHFDKPLHVLFQGSPQLSRMITDTVSSTIPTAQIHSQTSMSAGSIYYTKNKSYWKNKVLSIGTIDKQFKGANTIKEFIENQVLKRFTTESDYLGNVRATVKLTSGNAEVMNYTDYYPHGSAMPGRNYISSLSYKYGYQGQEKDGETGFLNFELRQYDARIGRWFNPDPMGQYFSPYLAMGNNPVSVVDPTGGWALSGGGSYNPSDEEILESGGSIGHSSYMDYMDAGFTSATDYALSGFYPNEGSFEQRSERQMVYFDRLHKYGTAKDKYEKRLEKSVPSIDGQPTPQAPVKPLHVNFNLAADFAWEQGRYDNWWTYRMKGIIGDQDNEKKIMRVVKPVGQLIVNLTPQGAASNAYYGFTKGVDIYGLQQSNVEIGLNAIGAILPFVKFRFAPPKGNFGVAVKTVGPSGIKLLPQFAKSTIDDATAYAMRTQNNIDHIFAAKHNLGILVTKFGGQRNTINAVLNAANGRFPSSGFFNFSINVGGQNVWIRGIVQEGMPKIGTMWIP